MIKSNAENLSGLRREIMTVTPGDLVSSQNTNNRVVWHNTLAHRQTLPVQNNLRIASLLWLIMVALDTLVK